MSSPTPPAPASTASSGASALPASSGASASPASVGSPARASGRGSRRMPDGPPPPPTVQKLRIRYSKRDRLRFTSTRDFQRALERALRLAQVPMAYSAGFHPHPKISYTNAAPTGTASEAEYVEISVAERLEPEAVRAALDAALPDGYGIEEVVESPGGSLADLLEGSVWRLDFGELVDDEAAELQRAVAAYLALEEAPVTRVLKKGPRTYDTRSAVLRLAPSADTSPCAILAMVVRHTTPVVRPEDVLTAMRTAVDLRLPRPPRVTRLAQGPLEPATATVADPFAATNAGGSGTGDA